MSVIAALEYRYANLLTGLERIRSAGDAVGVVPAGTLTALLTQALAWLDRRLLVHIAAEQAAVYPRIDHLLGDDAAGTDPGTLDHAEIARLTAELRRLHTVARTAALTAAQAAELRQVLYSLHAIGRMHIEAERTTYLPLLDARLPDRDAAAMFADLRAVVIAARHAAAASVGGFSPEKVGVREQPAAPAALTYV